MFSAIPRFSPSPLLALLGTQASINNVLRVRVKGRFSVIVTELWDTTTRLSSSGLLLADRKQVNVTDSGSVDAVEREDTTLLWYAKQQLVHILLEL